LSPPLARRAGKTVSIHLAEGTKLRDVLDLKLFDPLVPGITCKEASITLGVSGQYVESCTFELASAQIYVAYESGGSSLGTFHRRTLYAYPRPPNNDANTIVSKYLQPYRAVAAPGVVLELIVAEHGDNERAWVLVDGDFVKSINWWSPASRRPPDRPAQ